MEDKEIRPICLYKETCLDYKQGKRKCEDCIHNKEYWTEVQLRDMAQNIRRLHKENAELKAYMDVNEDFKTAWEELKAENETLKSQLDFEVQKKEVLEIKNERLKEDYIKLSQQKDLDNTRWQKRCTDLHIEDKAKADKYWLVLQEIKKIAEQIMDKNEFVYQNHRDIRQIIRLINESEGK